MKYYAVVTPFFPSPCNWRGAFCFDFVCALREQLKTLHEQWKVLVFVPGDGEDYEVGGVKVYRFKTKQLPSNIFPFLFRRYNERSFLNRVKEVLYSTVDQNPQSQPPASVSSCDLFSRVSVCHAHTANCVIYPLAIKKLNQDCRTLLHHHDPQSFGLGLGVLAHNWLYQLVEFTIVRSLHEQVDSHVFISEMVRRSFLSAPDASWTQYDDYRRQMRGPSIFHCRPARIKHSVVLHNGVDPAIFHPLSQPQPSTTTFTIGCIGNFLDWKDQETLIRAVALLKEPVRVIFVGSGPLLQHCKKLATSIVNLNLQPQPVFEFRSEVRHEELAAFYRSLNLFVLPSYFEGFGCVFTEAYASGVPFITCEGQGMDDLIPEAERHLWLCKQRDSKDLALKISYYVEHRPVQHLAGPVLFDDLMPRFLREIRKT